MLAGLWDHDGLGHVWGAPDPSPFDIARPAPEVSSTGGDPWR